MTVVLDTGSSDLWIPGDGCTLCGLHNTFDSSASSSYRPARQNGLGPPREFEIDYGSGAVAGTVAVESVILGGLLLDPVTFGEVNLHYYHSSAYLSTLHILFLEYCAMRVMSLSRHLHCESR
jgi:Eukaryotic aspartyl protease